MKKKLKALISDDFFRHFSIVTIGVGLASFLNLFYQLLLVRHLSEVQYGTLNILVSLLTVFLAVGQPLRTTLTKFLSEYFSRRQSEEAFFMLRHLFKRLGMTSMLCLAIFIFFNSYLADLFNIENYHHLLMIGIIISLSLITPIFYSFLWSRQLFKILVMVGLIAVLSKVVVGFSLVKLGFGVSGGLWGYLSLPVLTVLIYLCLVCKQGKFGPLNLKYLKPINMLPIYKYFLPTALALFSFRMLTNIDVVMVRIFFSKLDTGYYSVAQIVGKIILFLPGAVYVVIFPKSAALAANGIGATHLLKKGLLIIAVSCGLLTITCSLFPQLILKVLTSKAPIQSIRLVSLFAITMSFYALVGLLNLFHLSRHNTRFVLPIVILAFLQTLTIYLFHPSLTAVLQILLVFSILSFLAGLAVLKYETK